MARERISYRWMKRNVVYGDCLFAYRDRFGTVSHRPYDILDWLWWYGSKMLLTDVKGSFASDFLCSLFEFGLYVDYTNETGKVSDVEYSRERDKNRAFKRVDYKYLDKYLKKENRNGS